MSRADVGPAIRTKREALGLSQDDFGALLGVSGDTIGNWEANQNWPRGKAGLIKEELGLDIIAIRDDTRPAVADEDGDSDARRLALSIEVAIRALRAGDEAEWVINYLEIALQHGPTRPVSGTRSAERRN